MFLFSSSCHTRCLAELSFSTASTAIGVALFVFGFLIYYLVPRRINKRLELICVFSQLPLALLSFNLTLFFNIFFGILIGMLFGLILLALNLEHVLERFLVAVRYRLVDD